MRSKAKKKSPLPANKKTTTKAVASKKPAAKKAVPAVKKLTKPAASFKSTVSSNKSTSTINTSKENMELKTIQELINFVSKSGVSEVSIEQKDFKITVKTPSAFPSTIHTGSAPAASPAMVVNTPAAAPIAAAPAAAAPAAAPAAESASNLITIKAPMIGTFYRMPSPDKPSYVNVGDEVKAGKVVCIIEAMKLFNEIESEISGKIVKVLVDNASPVEYDQPLFLVEPN